MTQKQVHEMVRLREMLHELRMELLDLQIVCPATQRLTGMPFGGSGTSRPTEALALNIQAKSNRIYSITRDYESLVVEFDKMLESCDDVTAEILVLKYMDGYTNRSIGDSLVPRISKASVRQRVRRHWKEQAHDNMQRLP